MHARRVFALGGLALCFAWPLAAEAQSARAPRKRVASHPAAPITGFLTASQGTAAERRTRVGELREIDTVDPTGKRVLRGMTFGDNAELGVGIWSVAGETEKRTVRLRTDPRIDVVPGRTRVAGAGFAIRF